MSIDHWMMFGTFAQKEYFEYPKKGTYKGVIINANQAAHAPGGLASFLLEKTHKATYIIDPLTHAFQHDPDMVSNADGMPKSSVMTLARAYGDPIESNVGKRPILPEDFSDKSILREFVNRCIGFQRSQITQYMAESGAAKYLDEDEKSQPPYAVVAPYFYLTETTVDEWLAVNARAAKYAAQQNRDQTSKVFASIVVNKAVLEDGEVRNGVVEAYENSDVDGFLIWIDQLDESTASKTHLTAFLDMCRRLRKGKKREVINLHGGYFSVLGAGKLGRNALSGVTHGPEFGEHRGVLPVGGGIPIAKYYIPELHARIRYRDALKWFTSQNWLDSSTAFHQNVCDCPVCVETLSNDPDKFELFGRSNVKNVVRRGGIVRIDFPMKETQQRCLRHYLQRKYREYVAASESPEQTLLGNLNDGYNKYKPIAGLEAVGHLRTWHQIFKHIQDTDD